MRQILISKPGEFSNKSKRDHLRSEAVKRLAVLIKKEGSSDESTVVVSNKALRKNTTRGLP